MAELTAIHGLHFAVHINQAAATKMCCLITWKRYILGTKPVGASASNYRSLFLESHALALKDLQSRLERSDASEMKIFPLAEKVQRLEALKTKFPGIMLSTSMEPSHDIIDRVVHQYEENCIKLIDLHKCTSREQEIKSERSSSQLSFDAQGNIKVSKQSAVADCPINGEIKLRAAFTRRSLASFQVMEAWSQLFFDRVSPLTKLYKLIASSG